ncbi:MAG: helix-turn-helix transcriptional regulator [Oscillospiraceae bacterium]|nr:helix-turn-helix transcriptional regulator [Oscillospiraceae bacterium]
MFSALLKFNTVPKIGFAHHFYTDEYSFSYKELKKSFEIVYVKSGGIVAELYGEKLLAPEGSIFVLFRHLPFTLKSINNLPQSHCTVQVEFDYDFTLITDDNTSPHTGGLLLPFVTHPCAETEAIKKELFSIVSEMGISRTENNLSCSIKFLHIMQSLNSLARKNQSKQHSPASSITYKVKKYVAKNINSNISLPEIAKELGLTPGYINHVFKATAGIPIKQYINNEKVKKISELIQNQSLSFKTACSNVGISDLSYGYRLFKKHTGTTPNEFLTSVLCK